MNLRSVLLSVGCFAAVACHKRHLLANICLLAALAGCTHFDRATIGARETNESFTRFDSFPVPGGSRLDMDRTLVLGSDTGWTGRLTYFTNISPATIYEFYLAEMPLVGWREVMTVRSATSHLVFESSDRTVTIAIEPGLQLVSGTRVDINVVPGGR